MCYNCSIADAGSKLKLNSPVHLQQACQEVHPTGRQAAKHGRLMHKHSGRMRRASKDIKRRACTDSAQALSLSAAKHFSKKPEPTKLHQAIPSPAHMRVPALRSLFQTTANLLPVKPRPEHACSRLPCSSATPLSPTACNATSL